ncbi:hypothetical protein CY35_05G113700 [Sphagnum magellanicum]|nr:hypothetical protein CY35_05G113700 [Sphagnum magellanicum]KAH9563220.1 hypothetical protein CY35_05G113700 [Sphagnum magellanicum]KAH9563221.1 hypothetical protein CY35_05G113700 [Sphagnum magellanicum]KAH9563222.1 hypothetical protein CY35_05G113700 [Sphagnum magellanicum]KAH9563223.1 hypothetical protein CY35_05G113700 [Sphagnum magellanicum]
MKRGSSSISSNTLVPVIQPQFERAQQLNVRPDHLVVLVHGILASPSDWKYVEGELKSRLGNKFLIHASSVNSFLQTLAGIDLGGKRLADEVQQIVDGAPSLKRISFVAHSLGGLFARYAIAMLYTPQVGYNEDVILLEELESRGGSHEFPGFQQSHEEAKVAGLEAVNFITLASPHLGVRGKKQLPFLLGVPVLEKIAAPIAPFVVGQTGKQLFLTDGKPSDPPLLLRMASDCQEGPFISALRAFKSRVVYANVSYDHMVGWRTSSIRRESELSKPPRNSLNGYKHIVNVVYCPAVESKLPSFEQETARAKAAAQVAPSSKKAASYHDILEEEMVRGLQQVSWRKVDVSFHSALWPFLAHNAIHVKQEWLHYEGAGVIAHVADTLKQQELCVSLEASL